MKSSTYLHTTHGNGTPAYMSPECFGTEKISEKSDVFSLGMILWECLTGETPWREVRRKNEKGRGGHAGAWACMCVRVCVVCGARLN